MMQIWHFKRLNRTKTKMKRYIYGSKARFWAKFYYKNIDGFIVSRVGDIVVDVAV